MTLDFLLPAALLAGFFGSGHCFGMCGAIVALLERPAGERPWPRRLAANVGRLGFYAVLGAVAAGAGLVLSRVAGVDTGLRILRVLAGLLVVALAANLLFDLRSLSFLEKAGGRLWKLMSPLAARVLPANTVPRSFAAGFIWGALPCGLVYSAVALAATSGNAAAGALVMTAFWLGTLPALLATGTVAGRASGATGRPLLRRACGVLLLVLGLAAILMPYSHEGPHEAGPDEPGRHEGHGAAAPHQYPRAGSTTLNSGSPAMKRRTFSSISTG